MQTGGIPTLERACHAPGQEPKRFYTIVQRNRSVHHYTTRIRVDSWLRLEATPFCVTEGGCVVIPSSNPGKKGGAQTGPPSKGSGVRSTRTNNDAPGRVSDENIFFAVNGCQETNVHS